MRRKYASDLTRGFPTIVIAVAVVAALLGDVERPYIFTFAGTGEGGAGGDGGPATEAQLSSPYGLALDGSGNLYVADLSNNRIRRIDAEGVITTIGGTGERGFGGDGGPATEAQFNFPTGLAVDGSGNLYVADTGNTRIRRIDAEGVITTIAGTGERGFGGDGGPATEAQLSSPFGLAVDGSGNLYVADTNNHRIRRIDAEGVITTIAGTGEGGAGGDGGPATEAQFSSPYGLAVDGSGNLYVADLSNHRIRRIDAEGVITTIGGTGERGFGGDGGPATEAQFNFPTGLAVDGSGNLYVADTGNTRIRRIDAEGVITTIAGTGERGFGGDGGPATEAQFAWPTGLALDGSGNLYVADSGDNRVRRIDAEGVITTFAGTGKYGFGGDGGPATEAQFSWPWQLALDGSGNLYVADHDNSRIRRIDAEGVITTFAGTGEWGFSGDGGAATEAQFSGPNGLAVDGSGNLYVSDRGNSRIRRIDAEGVITTIAGSGPGSSSGGYSGDGGPATEAQFSGPNGLVLDGSGNLYVSDRHRIRVIRPPGERNPVTQEFPHFANGDSTVSDLVLVNVDTTTVTPVVRFYSSKGNPISADSLVDVTGDLELTADGALAFTAGIQPLAARTISTHGREALTSGSVRVVSDGYIGGFLRFDSMAVGVAGVGAAQPVNDALFPARRKEGGINTGAAVRNLETEAMTMTCHLMQGGDVLETAMVELAGDGQKAQFINELFPETDTSDFAGSVRCTAPEGKMFTGVALEMDIHNRIFTTLSLVAVAR